MNTTAPGTTSTPAILSLVFGIASWIALPFIGAIVAIVCGHIARGEIRRAAPGAIEGDGLAIGGLILGYLHLLFFVAAAMFVMLFLGGFAWFATHLH
jgi:hypothetical protein